MSISRTAKAIIAIFATSLLLAGGGLTILFSRLSDLDTYKEQILVQLRDSLKRPISYESGKFSFRFGPTFTFTNVEVKEPDGSATFLQVERLTCKIDLLPLLEKRIIIHELAAKKPLLQLIRSSDGRFNISDLLEAKESEIPLHLQDIWLEKGTIRFTDRLVEPAGLVTTLEEAEFYVSHLGRGKKCDFKLSARLGGPPGKNSITIGGKAKLAARSKPLTETSIDVRVLSKGLDAGHFWPYYQRHVPFRKVYGALDLDTSFKGKLHSFSSTGRMRITGLRFDYQPIFHAVLTPRDLRIAYDLELTPQEVNVRAVDLTMDGLNVKGSCAIRDIRSKDPLITARAVTSSFDLQRFHQYIPYGIIVKDTSEWIEQHIKGGVYKLDDGRLNGRVSQILHMELGENYNVLAIKGRVEKGVVGYGPQVPTFNAIKGELEMRGKDFILHRMSGNFGSSPFTMEGRITDYPLNKPSGYPFTMAINPRHGEVAWLLGKEKGGRLGYDGNSQLRLSGEGESSAYTIAGDWDLTPSAYSFPDLINKPAGRTNNLSFRGTITREEARLSSLQFSLPPLSLSMAAQYQFAPGRRLALSLKTNQFQLSEVAPMLPRLSRFQPSGRLQAAIQGEAPKSEASDLSWRGTLNFAGVSCKPGQGVKPVSDMSGVVTFSGTTLESSQLTARLGGSTVTGKGTLSGWEEPVVTLSFSSPLLDLADLGFSTPKGPLKIAKVKGEIALKENNLTIRSLSGQLRNSPIALKGRVDDIRNPRIDLAVTSPYLELEDILSLTELERPGQAGDRKSFTLNAAVRAEAGKLRDVPFEKLNTVTIYEGKILYLQPLEMNALGGKVSARGRVDYLSDTPRYQISYSLSNVAADRLTQAFGVKKTEITGTLSSQGELTARGGNAEELKRSALGSIKLSCEDGSLRRFAVLSKIFSILNVAQLLKFQLPDMVSGGMPYNQITGSFAIRDGVVSTSDLFVASDAMNISAVGKIDMVRDELDVTVGVQPLQTVDKVVSRIPIVGWILTGKDKALITTYFEAKGKLADPKVSAVPVKAMTKGVLDVFKRMFQLPAKLFTDTGEVIIGR